MKYGPIAENDAINATIYECFEVLSETDALKFVKEFREQPHDQPQVMHTFRELVFGAFLAKQGLSVRAKPEITTPSGQLATPDWGVYEPDGRLEWIMEAVTFNLDQATKTDLEKGLQERGMGGYWVNEKLTSSRLWSSLKTKFAKYNSIIDFFDIPYVVALYIPMSATVPFNIVIDALLNPESGLCREYPRVSGVLYCDQTWDYEFHPLPNPHASRSIELPSGDFYQPKK